MEKAERSVKAVKLACVSIVQSIWRRGVVVKGNDDPGKSELLV